MNDKIKRIIRIATAAVVFIAGAVICIADLAPAVLHLDQYLYNVLFFFIGIPLCVGLLDLVDVTLPKTYRHE